MCLYPVPNRWRIKQLAPAVQFQLALAGALSGWQYGLIAAVSPLAAVEDAKDLKFDSEVEAIRSAAAAARAAAMVGDSGDSDDQGDGGEVSGKMEGGMADATKELAAM